MSATPGARGPGGFATLGPVVNKNALRAGTLGAATTLMMLLSPAAFATTGDDPGQGLSVGQTLGLYVAIPLVAFAVIAGLVMLAEPRRKSQD